jgi:hypothetical protein
MYIKIIFDIFINIKQKGEKKMKELKKDFLEKRKFYKKRRNEIKEQIEILEEELNNLENPYWFEDLIKPLVKEVVNRVDELNYAHILGPSGLRNSVVLLFAEKKEYLDEIFDYPDKYYSIAIFPKYLDNAVFMYYTNEKAETQHEKGTIAEMNGMNNATEILPEDIDEIIKLILDPKI